MNAECTGHQAMTREGAVKPLSKVNGLAVKTRRPQQRGEVAFRLQESLLETCTRQIGPWREDRDLPIGPIGAAGFVGASLGSYGLRAPSLAAWTVARR